MSIPTIAQYEIHLDNERKVFLPGQRIEGFVVLNTTKDTKLHLKLSFSGKVTTHLHKGEFGARTETSVVTMFKDSHTLVGERLLRMVDLPAGEWIYPFTFRMPATSLPASFKSPFGFVEYSLDSTLLVTSMLRKRIKTVLTVPSSLNHHDVEFQEGVTASKTGWSGHKIWRDGRFDVKVSLPRKAYASEETVPVHVHILNHTPSALVLKSVSLKQKVKYINSSRYYLKLT